MTVKRSQLLLVVALVLGMASTAQAAPAQTTGVTVTPALKSLTLDASQPSTSFVVTLANDGASPVVVQPSVADFSAAGTNGGITLLKDGDPLHGLASRVHFSSAKVAIEASKTAKLTVSAQSLQDIAPGGHYAFVRYKVTQVASGTNSTLSLNQELSTFIFLVTNGTSTHGLRAVHSFAHVAPFELPNNLDSLFTNTGNTQSSPTGIVSVSDPFHKQVAQGTINTASSLVLPGSTRLFTTDLRPTQKAVLPGIYTYDVYYRSDEATKFTHTSQRFVYIGWPTVIVAVLFIIGMIRLLHTIKRRKLIKRHFQSKPESSKKRRSITVREL